MTEQPKVSDHEVQQSELVRNIATALGCDPESFEYYEIGDRLFDAHRNGIIDFDTYDALLQRYGKLNISLRKERLDVIRDHWAEMPPISEERMQQLRRTVDSIVASRSFAEFVIQHGESAQEFTAVEVIANQAIARFHGGCYSQSKKVKELLVAAPIGDLTFRIAFGVTQSTVFHIVVVGSEYSGADISRVQVLIDASLLQIYRSFAQPIPLQHMINHLKAIGGETITDSGVFVGTPLEYEQVLEGIAMNFEYGRGEEYADFTVLSDEQEKSLYADLNDVNSS